MTNIVKTFGEVHAIRNGNFNLFEGEIHSLIGENGAGKSTMMKILYGIYPIDGGDIEIYDKKMKDYTTKEAINLGIGMVHQEFMLVNEMTVLENIILGFEPKHSIAMVDFNEAKSINETRNEDEKVWVLGVDRDQTEEGKYKSKDGKESNFVLASSLKQVGKTVQDIANQTAKGKFPGGKTTTFGLKDGGVDLTTTNLSEDAKKAVEEAKAKILDGSITVPDK